MIKRKKLMLIFLVGIILLVAVSGAYVLREIGASPSKEEVAAWEKLPYFKNGEFQSPQKLVYDFANVRNGPVSWSRFLSRSVFAPDAPLPQIKLTKKDFPAEPEEFAFYWLGHSSAIMDLTGKRIIFDPVLGNAAPIPFAVPRYNEAVLSHKELPEADYVVITHNHYDHLERKTIQKLKNSRFIVPLGVGAALRGWGVSSSRIIELGWGDTFEQDGLKITAETAVHYSGRGFGGRNKTLWNSYVLQSGQKNIYWSGDSGYGEHLADIGRKYGAFDFAAIEIDGWNPAWPNTHMFPAQVLKAAQELHTTKIVPIHWAVFDLALHPWHESVDMLLEEAAETNIDILTPRMGEKINLDSKTLRWWRP